MEKRITSLMVGERGSINTGDSTRLCVIAEDILSEIPGKSAHIDDIAIIAVQKDRTLGLPADEFKRKLNSALAANVKRKTGATFSRVSYKKAGRNVNKKGWYRLKSRVPYSSPVAPPELPDNLYMGRFGEFAVISELLYWGMNVSQMIVDRGIDLVAEKNNKYFYLQVKATLENDNTWRYAIRRASFDLNHSYMLYYVFVLRSAKEIKNTFVIIPSTHIDALIKNGSLRGDSTSLSLKISTPDKGKKWNLNDVDCSIYVNAFAQLS